MRIEKIVERINYNTHFSTEQISFNTRAIQYIKYLMYTDITATNLYKNLAVAFVTCTTMHFLNHYHSLYLQDLKACLLGH